MSTARALAEVVKGAARKNDVRYWISNVRSYPNFPRCAMDRILQALEDRATYVCIIKKT